LLHLNRWRQRAGEGPGSKGWEMVMAISNAEAVVGRHCRLLRPVRDHEGRTRFGEKPKVLREINNLERRMLLVQFDDGATTFLFPDEVVVEN
jgi:hypothetical protein